MERTFTRVLLLNARVRIAWNFHEIAPIVVFCSRAGLSRRINAGDIGLDPFTLFITPERNVLLNGIENRFAAIDG